VGAASKLCSGDSGLCCGRRRAGVHLWCGPVWGCLVCSGAHDDMQRSRIARNIGRRSAGEDAGHRATVEVRWRNLRALAVQCVREAVSALGFPMVAQIAPSENFPSDIIPARNSPPHPCTRSAEARSNTVRARAVPHTSACLGGGGGEGCG